MKSIGLLTLVSLAAGILLLIVYFTIKMQVMIAPVQNQVFATAIILMLAGIMMELKRKKGDGVSADGI